MLFCSQEEELETEKRQQMFLLQELEEQKAKLEQMLLEAQQERDRLKAAAAQETLLNQAEEAARDQQVSPGLITQVVVAGSHMSMFGGGFGPVVGGFVFLLEDLGFDPQPRQSTDPSLPPIHSSLYE